MNRQSFWLLIEEAMAKDTNVMLTTLTKTLSVLPEEDVLIFRGYLSAYTECVSECIWTDMACKVINGYVSDDTGLYFALWVIAQGEQACHSALSDPDSLSALAFIPFGQAEFELLMSVGVGGEEALEDCYGFHSIAEKCGKEIQAAIVYKNDDKYGHYDSFEEAMEDIPNILPNLIERARKEGFDWMGTYTF